MADEISKMLTLSTAHVTEETAESLDDSPCLVAYAKDGYGWFIHVTPEPDGPEVPDDLRTVLAHARSLGCEWLCLDNGGFTNPALPTWEW